MLLLARQTIRIWTEQRTVAESGMRVSKVRTKGLVCAFEKNVTELIQN
jgi:hypothetical protein